MRTSRAGHGPVFPSVSRVVTRKARSIWQGPRDPCGRPRAAGRARRWSPARQPRRLRVALGRASGRRPRDRRGIRRGGLPHAGERESLAGVAAARQALYALERLDWQADAYADLVEVLRLGGSSTKRLTHSNRHTTATGAKATSSRQNVRRRGSPSCSKRSTVWRIDSPCACRNVRHDCRSVAALAVAQPWRGCSGRMWPRRRCRACAARRRSAGSPSSGSRARDAGSAPGRHGQSAVGRPGRCA